MSHLVAHTRATLLIASFITIGASNPFGQLTTMHNKPVISHEPGKLWTWIPLGFFSVVSTVERMNVGVPVAMRWLGFALSPDRR